MKKIFMLKVALKNICRQVSRNLKQGFAPHSSLDMNEEFMPIHAMKHGWVVLVYLGNVRGVGDDAE